MPTPSPQDESSIRPPHPLAARLVERLRERPESRILDFGAGSGRNSAALRRAGYDVVTVDDLGVGKDQVGWAGARQEITDVSKVEARGGILMVCLQP